MSETKYTPGPWEIEEDLGMDEAWCNWHRVGPVDLMGGKANANSRLIAAAPDLLEALKDARYALYGNGPGNPKIDAAISKAESSQP